MLIRASAHPPVRPRVLEGGPQGFPSRSLVILISRSSPRQGIGAIPTVRGGGGYNGSRGTTAIEPAPYERPYGILVAVVCKCIPIRVLQ